MLASKRHLPLFVIDRGDHKRPRLLSPVGTDHEYFPQSVSPYSGPNTIQQNYPITPLSQSRGSPAQPDTPVGATGLRQDSEILCFGTLCEVKARILKDPTVLEEACLHTATAHVPLQVILQKGKYFLRDSNGLDVALLHQKTADALQVLDDMGSVHYDAYVTAKIWKESINAAKGTANTVPMDIEINVSGPRFRAEDVGRVLSKAQLFLQRPSVLATGLVYENPHTIYFHELKSSITEHSMLAAPALALPSSSNRLNVQDVLDCLDQRGDLKSVMVDERIIKSKLHKHQKEAVDFVIKREAAWTSPAFSLWKPCQTRTGENCYQHVVLDIKKQDRPKENLGGIIADQMGLGKTLSMLAAISLTCNAAAGFVGDTNFSSMDDRPKTKATLVIVPSALILHGWMSEMDKHCVTGTMSRLKFHGSSRPRKPAALLSKDVVLTTYDTVAYDFMKGESILYKVSWYRIVLDEAHLICGQQTKRFCAASALEAQQRWCMTGTPIQNRLNDLAALIRFLRVPYLSNASSFTNYITKPIENHQARGIIRLRSLLKSICLRRTTDLLTLPPTITHVRRLELVEAERQVYSQIGAFYKKAMLDAVGEKRKKGTPQMGLCQAILQLRRCCNNGAPEHISLESQQSFDDTFSTLQQLGTTACSSCAQELGSIGDPDDSTSGILASCDHLLCSGCVSQGEQDGNGTRLACPVCGVWTDGTPQVSNRIVQPSSSQDGSMFFSTKLLAVVQDILQYQHAEKSIVFTAWRQTISSISSLLNINNVGHCIVEGSMSIPERKKALDRFQSDPFCTVLLMTFGTGSAGLNLTAASRIHLVEPQWNPSVESQAIGRAVRLGQQRNVTVLRYIVKDTVEEHMENSRTWKTQVANIGWDGDKESADDGKLKLIGKVVFNI